MILTAQSNNDKLHFGPKKSILATKSDLIGFSDVEALKQDGRQLIMRIFEIQINILSVLMTKLECL